MGAIASVVAKETFKDVGVIVAELLCDDAHLQVRICGKKILSKPKPRLDLISLHACAEGLAKGSLKGPHRGAELGRDPRHPELSMAMVDGDQVMRKHWGRFEFLGDFAFQYLDAYVTDQCEGLVFHTRQGGVLTRSQESTACPAGNRRVKRRWAGTSAPIRQSLCGPRPPWGEVVRVAYDSPQIQGTIAPREGAIVRRRLYQKRHTSVIRTNMTQVFFLVPYPAGFQTF